MSGSEAFLKGYAEVAGILDHLPALQKYITVRKVKTVNNC
jgi:hypothetical protein